MKQRKSTWIVLLFIFVAINTLVSITFFSVYEPDRKWISENDLLIVGLPNVVGIIALIVIMSRKLLNNIK